MTKKPQTSKDAAEKVVKNIRRKTRQTYSAEEKIRIVLAGLRGEESICVLCRREGIAESLYYSWSKEFLEAGKRRLSGDTARQATSPEVKDLRSESLALKECVADWPEPHDTAQAPPFVLAVIQSNHRLDLPQPRSGLRYAVAMPQSRHPPICSGCL